MQVAALISILPTEALTVVQCVQSVIDAHAGRDLPLWVAAATFAVLPAKLLLFCIHVGKHTLRRERG